MSSNVKFVWCTGHTKVKNQYYSVWAGRMSLGINQCRSVWTTRLDIIDCHCLLQQLCGNWTGSQSQHSESHKVAKIHLLVMEPQMWAHSLTWMNLNSNLPECGYLKHDTSLPVFPQSNGKAENAVRTIKQLFKKCCESGQSEYFSCNNSPENTVPGCCPLISSVGVFGLYVQDSSQPKLGIQLKKTSQPCAHRKPSRNTFIIDMSSPWIHLLQEKLFEWDCLENPLGVLEHTRAGRT